MEKILALLTNLEKAKAMKERLKAMPRHEKAKANYKKLWILVCDKVNLYAETKDKPPKPIVKEKKPELPKKIILTPPKFTKEEVATTTQALAEKYPKLFNIETPKPLKVGVLEDILALDNNWNGLLLKRAIKIYVRTEAYYLACANENHRYDLKGKKSGELSAENKQNAIDKIRELIGRFNMTSVYPELALKAKLPTPRMIKSEFYGNHYYHHEVYVEAKMLLMECYGKNNIKIRQKDAEVKGKFEATRIVMNGDAVLFEIKAEASKKKIANQLSEIKLLMYLQNNIDAYPFAYEKRVLNDSEVEEKFINHTGKT